MTKEWTEEQRRKVVAANSIELAVKRYLPSALESSEVEWLFKDDWPGNDVSMDRYLQLFQVLDELGQEQGCRGTYWRTLERAAATLGFEEFQGLFRRRFGDALKGLEGHD